MQKEFKTIVFQKKENGTFILELNSPEKKNALSLLFFEEANKAIDLFLNWEKARLLVITGDEEAFASGGDIGEMINMSEKEAVNSSEFAKSFFDRLEKLSFPVIAAINGYCVGGGIEMALACDILIASESAKFCMPEAKLGIVPGGGGTQRISRMIGLHNSLYLFFTSELFSASEALQFGIVQKVLPEQNFLNSVFQICDRIIKMAPEALAQIKAVSRKGLDLSFEEGNKLETAEFAKSLHKEGKVGLMAFLNKTSPDWEK